MPSFALDGLVVGAHGHRGAFRAPTGCALKTTALPAATMLMMLPLSVGTECVEGVIAPTTPKGVYSSSVMPWSPLRPSGCSHSTPGHQLDDLAASRSCGPAGRSSSPPIRSGPTRPHWPPPGSLTISTTLARAATPFSLSWKKPACAAAQASLASWKTPCLPRPIVLAAGWPLPPQAHASFGGAAGGRRLLRPAPAEAAKDFRDHITDQSFVDGAHNDLVARLAGRSPALQALTVWRYRFVCPAHPPYRRCR